MITVALGVEHGVAGAGVVFKTRTHMLPVVGPAEVYLLLVVAICPPAYVDIVVGERRGEAIKSYPLLAGAGQADHGGDLLIWCGVVEGFGEASFLVAMLMGMDSLSLP